jgi:hypothetical protein
LKAAPVHAPKRLQTTADLRRLQRLMTHALVRPLTRAGGLQRQWIDGRATAELAAEIIKPNDRLTSFERLEIYNRMYWYRLIGVRERRLPGTQGPAGRKPFRPAHPRLPCEVPVALIHPEKPLLTPSGVHPGGAGPVGAENSGRVRRRPLRMGADRGF